MDYSNYEERDRPQSFNDRRKPKCNGVRGQNHRWVTQPGEDCGWLQHYPWWSSSLTWTYTCQCVITCKTCNKHRPNYVGRKCAHQDWKSYTKPEEA